MGKPRVVLLHGLFRTGFSLWMLQRRLESEGFEVLNHSYPSRRAGISELAKAVADRIHEAFGGPGSEPINFVTHSLGGIISRALIAEQAERLPEVRRVVMLAPPNQGAQIVDRLKHLWLFQVVAGQAGLELTRESEGPGEDFGRYVLPVGDRAPQVGIIAGGRGKEPGFARWLEGDNDGTVEVSATLLRGAQDHVLVPHIHTFIMNAPVAIENSLLFLRRGRFADELPRVREEHS